MKSWSITDLEDVVKRGDFLCLPVVLLNRIAREAETTFDAKKGTLTTTVDAPCVSNGKVFLKGVLIFSTMELSWGRPGVRIEIEQIGKRFQVRVGAPENSAALGYSFEFGWADETPVDIFPALFACALDVMSTHAR